MDPPSVDPEDMVLFTEVVDAGSFTAAAQRVGVTKQTVSQRMARLEDRLGVRLLHRTTRSLSLTDAGARYHSRCVAIATRIAEANAEAQGERSEVAGRLRVSVPTAYGRRYLVPVLAELMAEAPRLTIEVVLTNRRVRLIDEGFDAALRIGPLDDSSLVARKIGQDRVHLVASPSFLDRNPELEAADLGNVLPHTRCIGLRPRENWALGDRRIDLEPALVLNDLEAVCDAAVAGLGVAMLPSFIHRDAVQRGDLVLLGGPEPLISRTLYAVYPSRRFLPVKVERFVDAVAARTAETFPPG